jgi:membrane protein
VPSPHTVLNLLRDALRRLFADEAVPLAGNIAFRSIFSLFPFLIFLTALAGFFGTEDQASRAVNYLLELGPPQLVGPLGNEIRSILTVPRADLLSLSALLTIWSAMAGVDSVRVGLNRAYDLKETRGLLRLYLLDIVFVIGSAVLMLIFAALIFVFPIVMAMLERFVPGASAGFATLEQLRIPLAVALLFVGLQIAHRTLPAKRLPALRVLPGVAFTVLIWIVLSAGFSAWLLRFNTFASTYASLSGIFTAMFFVYLAAIVLILGGEINRVLELRGAKASPPDLA